MINVLGKYVGKSLNMNLGAGINSIDLELKGLSNGVYFARIGIDDKYFVVKKLL